MTGLTKIMPTPGVFLTAEWRWLAMLNYEVEPALLQHRVPAGTELDEWNGRNFVSVVGFRFLKTRVLGVAVPFHRDFDEVNLRFYVRRRGPEGWRRGVVFVREFVPRAALAAVARLAYGEPYKAVPMRHEVEPEKGHTRYEWLSGGQWCVLETSFVGEGRLPSNGSLEAFLVEHYWGYTARSRGGSTEYGVEHPRWKLWTAASASLRCNVTAAYGTEFVAPLSARPATAFVADGSMVTVRRGVRVA
ncbi:MAG: YqjF family protein [Myxococcaceae bacterium]